MGPAPQLRHMAMMSQCVQHKMAVQPPGPSRDSGNDFVFPTLRRILVVFVYFLFISPWSYLFGLIYEARIYEI